MERIIGHGDPKLLNDPLFQKLGKKYNKSNVQVILRWHLQENNIFIPKSSNPAHIMDNFNIFDRKYCLFYIHSKTNVFKLYNYIIN